MSYILHTMKSEGQQAEEILAELREVKLLVGALLEVLTDEDIMACWVGGELQKVLVADLRKHKEKLMNLLIVHI